MCRRRPDWSLSEVRRSRSAFGRRETSTFDLLTPSVQHLVVDFSCFPKRIEKQTQFDDNRIHSGMFCFALVANPASNIFGSSGSQVATVQWNNLHLFCLFLFLQISCVISCERSGGSKGHFQAVTSNLLHLNLSIAEHTPNNSTCVASRIKNIRRLHVVDTLPWQHRLPAAH